MNACIYRTEGDPYERGTIPCIWSHGNLPLLRVAARKALKKLKVSRDNLHHLVGCRWKGDRCGGRRIAACWILVRLAEVLFWEETRPASQEKRTWKTKSCYSPRKNE